MKNKDEDGNEAEEAVRHDEVDEVIQVSAPQVKCECRARPVEVGILRQTVLVVNIYGSHTAKLIWK